MTNRISPAFIASCVLHGMVIVTFISVLHPPAPRLRSALPVVPLLTLVQPPQPVAASAPSQPKPVLPKPTPPPEPVNLSPAPEPIPEQPVVEPAPEPAEQAAMADQPTAAEATSSAPVSSFAPPPMDPVYPASKVKGGLVRLDNTEDPFYPLIAQDRGIEGSVDIQFIVDKSGGVGEIWIAQASHKFFSEAVLKNVKKWRFKPPIVNGKAARVKANKHFDFRLDAASE